MVHGRGGGWVGEVGNCMRGGGRAWEHVLEGSRMTDHCSLITNHYSLFTDHGSKITNHCSLFTVHKSLFTNQTSLLVGSGTCITYEDCDDDELCEEG